MIAVERDGLREFLTLFPQDDKLHLLFGDACRHQFFIRSAGVSSCLLDQLAQVVAYDCYAFVDFSDGRWDFNHHSAHEFVSLVMLKTTYQPMHRVGSPI